MCANRWHGRRGDGGPNHPDRRWQNHRDSSELRGIREAGATALDLKGYNRPARIVGMHDHMFFPMGGSPPMYSDMGTSFPRLYLALGVTTIRTTGSVAPYTDLEIKRLIDSGQMIGPKMHINRAVS